VEKATVTSLARFFSLLLVAVVVGVLQGDVELYLLLALSGYLLWHLWNLSRFEAWVKGGAREDTPDLPGIWGELVSVVIRLKRRSRERKKRYKDLIREFRKSSTALPDGAVVLDEQHSILWFNQAAGRMLGLKKSTDRGQSIANFIRNPEFVEFLENHGSGARLTLAAPKHPGSHYSMDMVSYGRNQWLLLVRDITREVRAEAMRRDFVANASHELRSPLTVLSGYLDAMADDPSIGQDWAGPLGEMRAQADRMTGIVEDMLLLSRLEDQDTGSRENEEVDVPRLLETLRKEAAALPDLPVRLELALDSSARLRGSEKDLRSAFNNLVENAIKYTSPGGKVTIQWTSGPDGATMSVTDTGQGIEEHEIPRVTQRFYRVDKSRSRDQGGTGLGLAIVKHVLQRHQAELEIVSQPGKGSTFSCRFPATRVLSG
jgi:two-component system phosphate regulon sensor histidine kinase PhoR